MDLREWSKGRFEQDKKRKCTTSTHLTHHRGMFACEFGLDPLEQHVLLSPISLLDL